MSEFTKFSRDAMSADFQPNNNGPAVTKSVFVGDLSFFCTEIELAMAFSPFGEIAALEIKRGRYGDSLMHGFVEYTTDVAAHKAIMEMNGKKFMGRKMRVNRTNVKVGPNPGYSEWVQIHVNFQTPAMTTKVSEEFLESVFCTFGSIGDITVKRHLCSRDPPQVTGYAFVYFLDAYAALRATHAVKGVTVEGITMECCLTYRSEQALMNQAGVANILRAQQAANAASNPKHQPHRRPAAPAHHQHAMPMYNKPPSPPSSAANNAFFPPSGRVSPTQMNAHRPMVSSVNNYHTQNFHQAQQQASHHYQFEREYAHKWSPHQQSMQSKFFDDSRPAPLFTNDNLAALGNAHKYPQQSGSSLFPPHAHNNMGLFASQFPSSTSMSSDSSASATGFAPRSSNSLDGRSEAEEADEVLAFLNQDWRSSHSSTASSGSGQDLFAAKMSSARPFLLQEEDDVFANLNSSHNNSFAFLDSTSHKQPNMPNYNAPALHPSHAAHAGKMHHQSMGPSFDMFNL